MRTVYASVPSSRSRTEPPSVVDVSSPRAWSAQRASVNRVTWCVRQAAPSCCTNVEGSCTSSLPPIRFLTLSGAPAVACGASREVATVHDCRRVASLTWARDEQLRWYDKRSRPCRACIIGMVRLRRLHALVLTQYAIVGVQARPPRMTSRGKKGQRWREPREPPGEACQSIRNYLRTLSSRPQPLSAAPPERRKP